MTYSLKRLVEDFSSGSVTAEDYFKQIEERFNRLEPQIQAFLPEPERFQRLHRELAELIKKYPDPQSRPLLFGVPVAIKDLYHVNGFETKAGSKLPPDVLTGEEGEVVKTLKASGAIILGKTVTTEFAYFASGPTRNPHNLNHTSGGSSSGSAAAVAAGLTPLAFGTQTIGSIIRPAAYCGVVGFKPSQGRIATSGIVPLSPSVDQPGFFTSDIQSAVVAASVVCKDWEVERNISSFRIGVPEGLYLPKISAETLEHFRKICDKLSNAGFTILSLEMLNDIEDIVQRHNTLVAAEAAIVHKDWFKKYFHLYHPQTSELIYRGQNINNEILQTCRKSCKSLREELIALMDDHNLSAIISPSTIGPAPLGLESTGDPVMNLPWTLAGLPVISIPSGSSNSGLPLGLQVVGKYWDDVELLKIASKIEKTLFF
ncbi:MAG: amidase [Bacteroidetes bacterium]|nr:amidase [Bacteroidota bacterium]